MRFAVALLLLGSAAWADEVTLKNGKKFTGIAREQGETVVLEMAIGTVMIPKDQVSNVTFAETPLHRFHDALKACAKVDEFLKLARATTIPRLANVAYAKIVELDAEHAEARKVLGHEKVAGAWTTREEREEMARAEREEQRDKEIFAKIAEKRRQRDELAAVERTYARRVEPVEDDYGLAYPWGYSFFRRRVAPGAAAGVPLWTPLYYPEFCPLDPFSCRRPAVATREALPGVGFNTPHHQALYKYYSYGGGRPR